MISWVVLFLVIAPLIGLVIFSATVLIAIRVIRGGASESGPHLSANETQTIQETYKGLSAMEKRIEALETILVERERKETDDD